MSVPLTDPITMVVRRSGDVRIHTFVSSFDGNNIANATHIVESKNKLVLIDGQFLAPYARKFREYADSLGKPIERLYLSHRHPDHWKLGTFAPESIVVPEGIAEPGEETIDGISYLFDRITETEIDYHLTIRLPELGVHFAQDLIYSGTHLYLTSDMQHWIRVLSQMLQEDYDLYMPGHGLPADKNEVARNVEYLAAARQAIDDGMAGDAFKNYLLQRYPERRCPGIFDIYLPRLFGGASEY